MKSALEGITVIDISNVIAGPTSGKLLADYGAKVIKVEHPTIGDAVRAFGYEKNGVPLWWKVLNRNKYAITLNLSTVEGQDILKKMLSKADVLIHNYRPGKMKEWGLDYDTLKEINKGLIMLEISGFGQEGPYSCKPGFGTAAEAMSGFSFTHGWPDKPPLMPTITLADSVTGIYGALCIAFALRWRDSKYGNGQGQSIDLCLYESLFSIMDCMVTEYDQLGIVERRTGNMPENTAGPRNAYLTSDNKWMAVSANSRGPLIRTLELLGLKDDPILGDPDNIVPNLAEIDRLLGEWMSKHTAEEAQKIFDSYDAVVFPVYSVEEIMKDPQYNYRNSIIDVADEDLGQLKMQGLVAKLSETPGDVKFAGQRKGQSNKLIFENCLNISDEKLEEYKEKGVI